MKVSEIYQRKIWIKIIVQATLNPSPFNSITEVMLICKCWIQNERFLFIFQGNKLDFHLAMSGEAAKNMYFDLLSELRKGHSEEKIKDGQFGANMEVNIANDGPVTIELESLSQTNTKD